MVGERMNFYLDVERMKYYSGAWFSKSSGMRFHYVIDGKSLCGKAFGVKADFEIDSIPTSERVFGADIELPKYFLIPKAEHICKRCSNALYQIGFKIRQKERESNKRGVRE